jgi:transcription elongation factor Elf1
VLRYWELFFDGYRVKPPNEEAECIDAEIAEGMVCPHCGAHLTYYPFTKEGSYIAMARCDKCKHEVEF